MSCIFNRLNYILFQILVTNPLIVYLGYKFFFSPVIKLLVKSSKCASKLNPLVKSSKMLSKKS